MGDCCNRRTFDDHVARRVHRELLEQGEPAARPGFITYIQAKVWSQLGGRGMSIEQVRHIVYSAAFRGAISEELHRPRQIFAGRVARHAGKIMTWLGIDDPTGELMCYIQEEMWGIAGHRVRLGQTRQRLRRLSDKLCAEHLADDIVHEKYDILLDKRAAREEIDFEEEVDLGQLREPSRDELDQMDEGLELIELWGLDEVESHTIFVHRHSGDCRCGTRVLAGVISDYDGGDDVTAAREGCYGRPAALSHTRPSYQDYMGVNPLLVS